MKSNKSKSIIIVLVAIIISLVVVLFVTTTSYENEIDSLNMTIEEQEDEIGSLKNRLDNIYELAVEGAQMADDGVYESYGEMPYILDDCEYKFFDIRNEAEY